MYIPHINSSYLASYIKVEYHEKSCKIQCLSVRFQNLETGRYGPESGPGCSNLAPVVRTLDSAIHRIIHSTADKYWES